MEKNDPQHKKFARSPTAGMWLGKDGSGAWRVAQDFQAAWGFDDAQQANDSWDKACQECLQRCAKSGAPVPAWASVKPVILLGRTTECAPGSFEFFLALIDGRFVCEKPSGMALCTDEREAKAYGTREEALRAIELAKSTKSKSAAVVPLACLPLEPVEFKGLELDALAKSIYAKALRDQWTDWVEKPSDEAGESEKGKGTKSKSL